MRGIPNKEMPSALAGEALKRMSNVNWGYRAVYKRKSLRDDRLFIRLAEGDAILRLDLNIRTQVIEITPELQVKIC